MKERPVQVICSDKSLFVKPSILNQSEYLQNLIEKSKNNKIQLSDVKIENFRKIMTFLSFTQNHKPSLIQKPIKTQNFEDIGLQDWEIEFLEFEDLKGLLELIAISKKLKIKHLKDLCFAKIATKIHNRKPEQIIKDLSLKNEFMNN